MQGIDEVFPPVERKQLDEKGFGGPDDGGSEDSEDRGPGDRHEPVQIATDEDFEETTGDETRVVTGDLAAKAPYQLCLCVSVSVCVCVCVCVCVLDPPANQPFV